MYGYLCECNLQTVGHAHKFTCFGDTSHSPNFDVATSLPFLAKETGWYSHAHGHYYDHNDEYKGKRTKDRTQHNTSNWNIGCKTKTAKNLINKLGFKR